MVTGSSTDSIEPSVATRRLRSSAGSLVDTSARLPASGSTGAADERGPCVRGLGHPYQAVWPRRVQPGQHPTERYGDLSRELKSELKVWPRSAASSLTERAAS